MQETILALGALMIVMLIAVNQQRSSLRVHEQVYVREIAHARDDFGINLLEGIVHEMNFDEATIPLTDIPTDPTVLSATLGPEGVTEIDANSFDDLDDFHAYRDTFLHVISVDSFRFDVTFSVNYLTETSAVSATRTFSKEITAVIDPLDSFGTYASQLTGRFSKTMVVSDSF